MGTKRRLGTALGAIGVAVLLVRLLVKFHEAMSYPDGLKVLGVALLIMAVVIPPWLAGCSTRREHSRGGCSWTILEPSSSTPSGPGENSGDSSRRGR